MITNKSYFFDVEVFQNDWIVCFINAKSEEKIYVHNNRDLLEETLKKMDLIIGFNNGFYDNKILKAILSEMGNIKKISDDIIEGVPVRIPNAWIPDAWDIKLTSAKTLDPNCSLKQIEIFYYDIVAIDTPVDFNLTRPLTEDEVQKVIEYCFNDVLYAKKIFFDKCLGEFEAYELLLDTFNIDKHKFLCRTKPAISNEILAPGRQKIEYPDKELYLMPPRELCEAIPDELWDFYVKNQYKKDDPRSVKMTLNVAGLDCLYGTGGIHGALPNYRSPKGVRVYDSDVASLYPSLMIEYKLFSRNSLGIAAYADIKKRRIAMKKAKDPRQLAFKIVLNGTYGILGSDYYAFGDPLYMYTVCIYGQLLLTDCMCRLYNAGYKIVQINTDGIMFEENPELGDKYQEILDEWTKKTRLDFETDIFETFVQRDVNNYLATLPNGKKKTCGAFGESINRPRFVYKLLEKMIEGTLTDEDFRSLELRDYVHIVRVKGATKGVRVGDRVFTERALGVVPTKKGFKVSAITEDKNGLQNDSKKIPYLETGKVYKIDEMTIDDVDFEACRAELAAILSGSGTKKEKYVIINDSFQIDEDGNRISINPLSDSHLDDLYPNTKNVKRRYMLFERDDLPYDEQLDWMYAAKPIISRAIFTGNKSIHCIVDLGCNILSEDVYRAIWQEVNETWFGGKSDPGTCSSHVYTRIPGRINSKTGREQRLLYSSDAIYKPKYEPKGTTPQYKRQKMGKVATIKNYQKLKLEYVNGNRYNTFRELLKKDYWEHIGLNQILEDFGWDKEMQPSIGKLKALYAGYDN